MQVSGQEETLEAENLLPPPPGLLLRLPVTDLSQHPFLPTSLPPAPTLSVSYISLVTISWNNF